MSVHSSSHNDVARLENTLLSVLAQARARNARLDEVEGYMGQLKFDSSRRLAQALFDQGEPDEQTRKDAQALLDWARGE